MYMPPSHPLYVQPARVGPIEDHLHLPFHTACTSSVHSQFYTLVQILGYCTGCHVFKGTNPQLVVRRHEQARLRDALAALEAAAAAKAVDMAAVTDGGSQVGALKKAYDHQLIQAEAERAALEAVRKTLETVS